MDYMVHSTVSYPWNDDGPNFYLNDSRAIHLYHLTLDKRFIVCKISMCKMTDEEMNMKFHGEIKMCKDLRCKQQSYLKHRRQNNERYECIFCSDDTFSVFGPSTFGSSRSVS